MGRVIPDSNAPLLLSLVARTFCVNGSPILSIALMVTTRLLLLRGSLRCSILPSCWRPTIGCRIAQYKQLVDTVFFAPFSGALGSDTALPHISRNPSWGPGVCCKPTQYCGGTASTTRTLATRLWRSGLQALPLRLGEADQERRLSEGCLVNYVERQFHAIAHSGLSHHLCQMSFNSAFLNCQSFAYFSVRLGVGQ
jgi:hypothetical protein